MKNYDQILVFDFGSQYNQLIVRRIREMGVYANLVSYDISIDEVKKISNLKGIILSGGPILFMMKMLLVVTKRFLL